MRINKEIIMNLKRLIKNVKGFVKFRPLPLPTLSETVKSFHTHLQNLDLFNEKPQSRFE